jgi:hypothetical protein
LHGQRQQLARIKSATGTDRSSIFHGQKQQLARIEAATGTNRAAFDTLIAFLQDSTQWKLLNITNPWYFLSSHRIPRSVGNHFCDAEYFCKRKFERERVSTMQSIQIFSAFQTTLTLLRNENLSEISVLSPTK